MKCTKIMLSGLVAFAVTANAMPTQEQTKKVEPLVMDLMREAQAALKSGKKTRVEVAESAMELADKADELVKCFRTHAAKLYEAAIASGDIKGLNKVQAERRIGEAKEYGETNFCEIVGEDVQPFSVELANADKIEFIRCPAGTFMMGWSAENVMSAGGHKDAFTPHHVKITRPFLLSKWAVTRKQWSAIMGENDYKEGKKRIPDIASARVFFQYACKKN